MSKKSTSVTLIALATLGVATSAGAQTGSPMRAPPMSEAPAVRPPATAQPLIRVAPIGTLGGTYTFTLDSFKITDTRALHNDTDFVQIGVKVGSGAAITAPAKAMGDVNNGTHTVNLSVPNVFVPAGETAVFSYSIVNTGYDANSVEQALKSGVSAALPGALQAAATAGGTAAGCAACGAIVGKQASSWFTGKVENILFPNCDGTVAAADHAFPQASLTQATANGNVIVATDDNKGTDSPTGCGANSRYYVTWSVSATGTSLPAVTTGSSGGGGGRPLGGGATHREN
jgi:hypothetical protein